MKFYETRITGLCFSDIVYADILYPCGELIAGWECETFKEAGELIRNYLKINHIAKHSNCTDEYCQN